MDKEKVLEFLLTDAGKKLLQPKLDRNFSKGLETWREKTLPRLIEEHEQKKLGIEPIDNKLAELQSQLELKRKTKMLKMKSSEVGLDTFVPFQAIAEVLTTLDEEQAIKTIETLHNHFDAIFSDMLTLEIKSRLPDTTPGNYGQTSQDTGLGMTKEKLVKLPYEERLKVYQQSPENYRLIMKS